MIDEGGTLPRRRGRKLTAAGAVAQVFAVFALTQQHRPPGSIAETARVCLLSRATVRKILRGTHGQPSPNLGSMLAEGEQETAAPVRCRQCGAVNMIVPCRTCKARRGLADLKRLQSLAGRAKSHRSTGFLPRRPRRIAGGSSRQRDPSGQRLPPPGSSQSDALALQLGEVQSPTPR